MAIGKVHVLLPVVISHVVFASANDQTLQGFHPRGVEPRAGDLRIKGHEQPYIVAIRDELAAGRTARALSLCNDALREIDNQADVVAPTRERPA